MNDQQYREHCLEQLTRFAAHFFEQVKDSSPDDPVRELARAFEGIAAGDGLYETGPDLVARLFSSCPQIAPSFPRELLWFLGGDCLHFMPDEELGMFQELDDMRLEAEQSGVHLDYQEARANLLKLQ